MNFFNNVSLARLVILDPEMTLPCEKPTKTYSAKRSLNFYEVSVNQTGHVARTAER